jgi:hypothetical protein
MSLKVVVMVVSWQMNRFERILFRVALGLAALLLAVRLAFIALVWYLHHVH